MEFQIAGQGDLPTHLTDLAEAVAIRLSLALENARLLERVQMQAQREQRLNVASTSLQAADDLDYLLSLAAEEFNEALGSARTRIRLQLGDQVLPS